MYTLRLNVLVGDEVGVTEDIRKFATLTEAVALAREVFDTLPLVSIEIVKDGVVVETVSKLH